MPGMKGVAEHSLDNGLAVLMKPMRSAPVVSVWIWYGVGARNERPGITGVSHWVEHMLFKGTPDFPKGQIFKSICRVGGQNNGFTNSDCTVYFETLPREHYDLGLRIEADRMVNSFFNPEEVASERSVIISEREGRENSPEARLNEELNATAFQVHPYRWPVLGYKCDLRAMTRDDLYGYYRSFYVPNNATLVLVGDFEPEGAMELINRRFGAIPSGTVNTNVRSVEPEQVGERRLEVRRPGKAVYWSGGCHTPAYSHPDRIPLMVLEAIFSGAHPLSWSGGGYMGKSARLHDALVNRRKVAVSAGGGCWFKKDPGLFGFGMMLRDDVSPKKAEAAMFAEIEKIKDKGPTSAEMKKALTQMTAQVEYARDGITANALMIGHRNLMGDKSDPSELLEQIAAVTTDDVMRVARAYLTERNRTVGIFIPENPGSSSPTVIAAPACKPQIHPLAFNIAEPGAMRNSNIAFWNMDDIFKKELGIPIAKGLPSVRERTLECGARVLSIENPESHCVAVAGFMRGGAAADPAGKKGLACFASSMIEQGTKKRNCKQIAEATDRIGASVYFYGNHESVGFGGKCLPGHLVRILELQRDCFENMSASEDEMEKERALRLTSLKANLDSTRWRAAMAAAKALYPGDHLYASDIRGDADSIAAITREDVLKYAANVFGPRNMTIVIVGPLKFDKVCASVEKAFGSWQSAATTPVFEIAEISRPDSPGMHVVEMDGKSQCDIAVVRPLVPRRHPDYFALRVADMILGRFGLMGRIGDKVRDEMGLAYYAHSSQAFHPYCGEWRVNAGVNPSNVRKAIDAIDSEIRRICAERATDGELSDSKGSMLGSLPLNLETSESLCHTVDDLAFYGLPFDYLEQYKTAVQAVTADDVIRVACAYLRGREAVIAVAGPKLP
ncbi:MAG TPA: pitrilysin family protein [Candidatus Brocadiia bacterium]|nr:pitrilysin family protein [Candidatus Brocadiia bacterium]